MKLHHLLVALLLAGAAAAHPNAQLAEPASLGPKGARILSAVVHPTDPDEILLARVVDEGFPGSNLLRSIDGGSSFHSEPGDAEYLARIYRDPRVAGWLYGLRAASPSVYGDPVRSVDFGRTWTSLDAPYYEYEGVAVSGDGFRLLAWNGRNYSYHVDRSTDGGASWQSVPAPVSPQVSAVVAAEFAPSDPAVIYLNAGTPGQFHLFRSDDAGASFAHVWSWPAGQGWFMRFAVHPLDPDTVLLADIVDDVLWTSADGGASFQSQSLPGLRGAIWEPDASYLWSLTDQGPLHSTDTGATWTAAPGSPGVVTGLAPAPLGDRYLWTSSELFRMPAGVPGPAEDLGIAARWIEDVAVLAPAGDRLSFARIFFHVPHVAGPDEPFTVLGTPLLAEDGFAVRPDDPATWVAAEGEYDCNFFTCFDRLDTRVYSGSGASSVVASESQSFSTQYGERHFAAEFAFDPADSNRVVRVVRYSRPSDGTRVDTSLDGGLSWTAAGPPHPTTPGFPGLFPRPRGCVAFDPFVPGRVLLLGELVGADSSVELSLSESLDGGQTWGTPVSLWPLADPFPVLMFAKDTPIQATLLSFDPHFPGILYVGDTTNGLRVSFDSGNTWYDTGVALSRDSELVLHPGLPGLSWINDAAGTVLASRDFGFGHVSAWPDQGSRRAVALDLDTADGSLLVGTLGSSVWSLPHASPHVVHGEGTEGSGGFVPRHYPRGGAPTIGNAAFSLAGDRVPGGALVFPVLGFDVLPFPAYGGTWYVDGFTLPWIFLPATASVGAPGVPGAAYFEAPLPIPADPTFAGVRIVTQCVAIDPGAAHPDGLTLTNALETVLLP